MPVPPILRRAALALTAVLAAGQLSSAAPAAATGSLPADPARKGYIGFCDEKGHNVLGGSLATEPFVWKAVASVPPPAAFQGRGQNAVLNIYQPRPGVLPGDWSGTQLTGASFYESAQHPAVQSTYADPSLKSVVDVYPPLVDGLYVLRMAFGKADYGLYNTTYPVTVIRVTGDRWNVVDGGPVDCRVARGVSQEQLTGVVTKKQFEAQPARAAAAERAAASAVAAAAAAPTGKGGSRSAARATGSGAGATGGVQSGSASKAAAESSAGPGSAVWVLLLVAALLALAVVIALRRRARGGARTP